jgi:hypothetical protein
VNLGTGSPTIARTPAQRKGVYFYFEGGTPTGNTPRVHGARMFRFTFKRITDPAQHRRSRESVVVLGAVMSIAWIILSILVERRGDTWGRDWCWLLAAFWAAAALLLFLRMRYLDASHRMRWVKHPDLTGEPSSFEAPPRLRE